MSPRIDTKISTSQPSSRRRRVFLANAMGLLALPLLFHAWTLLKSAQHYALVLSIQCEHPTQASFTVNTGSEFENGRTYQESLPGAKGPQTVRLPLPGARFLALGAEFASETNIAFGDLQIVTDGDALFGRDAVVATQPASAFHLAADGRTRVLQLDHPFKIDVDGGAFCQNLALDLMVYLLAGVGLHRWAQRRPELRAALRQAAATQAAMFRNVRAFGMRRPAAIIWLAALLGVLGSCFPVVFCGKSFVSPNLTLPLLYNHLPTLPGSTDPTPGNNQLSDVAATMLVFVPYSVVEHRAIFHDHELPLWHRDDAGGIPLLGQAQSMLGDPLHWIPVLADGAAWAWDLKFLLAKLLFAAGIGLAVYWLTSGLAAASLLAFSSCFISFFIFRLNHPTYFSVCYAPWIICAWLLCARNGKGRAFCLLFLANWMEFNSGAAKESVILVLHGNACGLLLFIALAPAEKWKRLGMATFLGACFVLISSPFWLTALDAVTHSWSSYDTPNAYQIQPSLLLGFFDDIYYRQFNVGERLFSPGVNFLALLGVSLAIAHLRELRKDRSFLVIAACALPSLAIVFGVVPRWVIISIPFVGHIVHVDTTFSCTLIINCLLLAGYGINAFRCNILSAEWKLDLYAAVAVLAVLLGAFIGLTQTSQMTTFNPRQAMANLSVSTFCWEYTAALSIGFIGLPIFLRAMWRDRGATFVAYAPWLALCLGALLWRHALQMPGVSLRYAMSPGPRVNLQASSPAVEFLKERQRTSPGRTMGIASRLAPSFNAIYGLESPSGADALQNRAYHDLLAASGVRYWSHWYLVADRPALPADRRFFDALNVRYYLDGPFEDSGDPSPELRPLGNFDLDAFESDSAWPRAFFCSAVSTSDSPAQFCRQIANGDGRPFISVAPGEEVGALPQDLAGREIVGATDYRLTSNTTSFKVRAPGPGVIALLEGYEKDGAQVTVNGRPSAAFCVNAAFSGVCVPQAGEYTIVFRYWPRFLTAGFWMAALGTALLVSAACCAYFFKSASSATKRANSRSRASSSGSLNNDEGCTVIIALDA